MKQAFMSGVGNLDGERVAHRENGQSRTKGLPFQIWSPGPQSPTKLGPQTHSEHVPERPLTRYLKGILVLPEISRRQFKPPTIL